MKVFKYRAADETTFERDLCSLKEDYFWASTREQLNDPFEGMFGTDRLTNQIKLIDESLASKSESLVGLFDGVKAVIEDVLAFVDKSGIFSLSKNPTEELLWAHYGNSHQGFCIEYDLDKLMSLEPEQYSHLDVLYKKAPPHIELIDLVPRTTEKKILQKMLGTKSLAWNYEREVRVITTVLGKQQYDFRAVKSVYFGHRMEDSKQLKIMEELAGRGITYYKIELDKNSYCLKYAPISDPHQNAPRYLHSIGTIVDGAIYTNDLKPELKKYEEYLYKAAEIVRREPYCNHIEHVDFSTSKGTPNAPVIFVHYEREPNKFINHYLTLAEIDTQFAKIDDLGAEKVNIV